MPEAFVTLKPDRPLSEREAAALGDNAKQLGQSLGCRVVVVPHDVTLNTNLDLSPLIAAMEAQTAAMDRLVQSNALLVQALAEDLVDDDVGRPGAYLDGKSP